MPVVHTQYNDPINLYSADTAAQAYDQQTRGGAGARLVF